MIYFITLLLLIILVLFFETEEKVKRSRIVYNIIFLYLTILVGFRYYVGGDWGGYATDILELKDFLENKSILSIFHGINFQPHQGYILILYAVSFFSDEIYLVNLIAAIIFCYGLVRLSILQPYPILSIYIAFSYFVVAYAMNFTKQSISMGLIMLILSIQDKKIYLRIFLFIISVFIHYYTIILLPFIFNYSKLNYKTTYNKFLITSFSFGVSIILIYILILILNLNSLSFFTNFIEAIPLVGTIKGSFINYFINVQSNYISYSITIRSSFMIILFFIFIFYVEEFRKYNDYFFNFLSFIFIIPLFIIHFLGESGIIRILVYFSILNITIVGKIPSFITNQSARLISLFSIIIFYLLFFTIWLNYSPRKNAFIDYNNILFQW